MTLRERATPFHGGYRIETPGPRASLFLFVYSYGPNGAMYIIRHGLTKKIVLEHFVRAR